MQKIKGLLLSSLMTTLLCISAQISIPIGSIPFTLQMLIVFLIPFLLTPMRSFTAMGIYILLGLAGLPVFAGAGGGIYYVLKPSFGFLLGMLLLCPLCSSIFLHLRGENHVKRIILNGALMLLLLAGIYVTGASYMYLIMPANGMPISYAEAFAASVIPFIGFDLLKLALALALVGLVYPALKKARLIK